MRQTGDPLAWRIASRAVPAKWYRPPRHRRLGTTSIPSHVPQRHAHPPRRLGRLALLRDLNALLPAPTLVRTHDIARVATSSSSPTLPSQLRHCVSGPCHVSSAFPLPFTIRTIRNGLHSWDANSSECSLIHPSSAALPERNRCHGTYSWRPVSLLTCNRQEQGG